MRKIALVLFFIVLVVAAFWACGMIFGIYVFAPRFLTDPLMLLLCLIPWVVLFSAALGFRALHKKTSIHLFLSRLPLISSGVLLLPGVVIIALDIVGHAIPAGRIVGFLGGLLAAIIMVMMAIGIVITMNRYSKRRQGRTLLERLVLIPAARSCIIAYGIILAGYFLFDWNLRLVFIFIFLDWVIEAFFISLSLGYLGIQKKDKKEIRNAVGFFFGFLCLICFYGYITMWSLSAIKQADYSGAHSVSKIGPEDIYELSIPLLVIFILAFLQMIFDILHHRTSEFQVASEFAIIRIWPGMMFWLPLLWLSNVIALLSQTAGGFLLTVVVVLVTFELYLIIRLVKHYEKKALDMIGHHETI